MTDLQKHYSGIVLYPPHLKMAYGFWMSCLNTSKKKQVKFIFFSTLADLLLIFFPFFLLKVEPRYSLQIWWCNSTDKSCYDSPLPEPLPPSPPFLKMDQSKLKNASSLMSTLRLDNMAESHLGRYYCVAHSEGQYTTATPGYAEVFIDIQGTNKNFFWDFILICSFNVSGCEVSLGVWCNYSVKIVTIDCLVQPWLTLEK